MMHFCAVNIHCIILIACTPALRIETNPTLKWCHAQFLTNFTRINFVQLIFYGTSRLSTIALLKHSFMKVTLKWACECCLFDKLHQCLHMLTPVYTISIKFYQYEKPIFLIPVYIRTCIWAPGKFNDWPLCYVLLQNIVILLLIFYFYNIKSLL